VAANEPHPRAETQRAGLGLDYNEGIEIVDWNGPGDPENPCVNTKSTNANAKLTARSRCRFNWSTGYKWTATLTTCFMYALVTFFYDVLLSLPADLSLLAFQQAPTERRRFKCRETGISMSLHFHTWHLL
jgi:hypothetical protein